LEKRQKKTTNLEFTGERFIPNIPELKHLYQEHIIRYQFASQFVREKKVLDAGCGTGYGSFLILKQGATHVTGIDNSSEAIDFCKKHYRDKNLDFKIDDCTKCHLKDSSYDVVVSFEVIEHVSDANSCLSEMKRVMKKNGIFVVSTPNKLIYPEGNIFHTKEFSESEFKSLLKKFFKNVTILYENYPSSLGIFRSGQQQNMDEIDIPNHGIGEKDNSALYFVAVCSDVKVQVQNKLFLFNDKTSLLENYPNLLKTQKEFEERTNWALELDEKLKQKNEESISIRTKFDSEISKKESKIDKLSSDISSKKSKIDKLSSDISSKKSKIDKLSSGISSKESKIDELSSDLSSKESKIDKLSSDLSSKESKIDELSSDISLKSSQLDEIQQSLSKQENEVYEIKDSLLKSKIDELISDLSSKKSKIEKLSSDISSKSSQLAEKGSHLETKNSEVNELQNALYSRDEEFQNLENAILFKIPFKIARGLDKVFPRGSKGGESIRLAKVATSTAKNEGFKVLFQAFLQKFRHKKIVQTKKPIQSSRESKTISLPKLIHITSNQPLDQKLRKFIDIDSSNILNLPSYPKISIIIPTLDQVDLLRRNLDSIVEKSTYKNYEIIIVTNNLDKNSEMRKFLDSVNHDVQIFDDKYSFSKINNFASKQAKGEFLLFLNDDIEIKSPNWLQAMIKLGLQDNVGVVGSKLIYPDGNLQEAGGIVWKGGIVWNHGRNANSSEPQFNFVRNTDFCSGACLLIKKELFEKLGGFDETYFPAYGEDADLCLSLQKLGYKILYQPLSTLIHHEGKTQGTDVKSGIKSYQIKNLEKLRKKWDKFLESRSNDSQTNVFRERNRKNGLSILYIDHYVPEYDKDAGSLLIYYVLGILSYLEHHVTFWPDNLKKTEPYTTELQQKGVEVIYGPNNFESYIKRYGKDFDYCIISRAHIAPKYIDLVKKYSKACKIIYDAIDLSFLRESREAELKNDHSLQNISIETKQLESDIIRKSDITILKTKEEANIINNENLTSSIAIIPTIEIPPDEFIPYSSRKDILFLGGFQHPPNIDSLEYTLKEIFPKLHTKLPDVKLLVVGSNAPKEVIDLCSKFDNVDFLGYVKDVKKYLKECRLLIAPLRFGAGMKGKITQSMAYGLVVITTPIGAEGISNENENLMMISESENDFANKTYDAYTNEKLWTEISTNANKYAKIHFTPEVVKAVFETILK